MTQKRFSLVACWLVGGLLVLESFAMLFVAMFTLIIGGLAGALAFGVGGGSATNAKLAQGFAVMALTLASPFVASVVLAIAGVLLLLRRQKSIVISIGFFAIAAQVAFHLQFAQALSVAALVPCAVQVMAIAVAIAFVPARVVPVGAS